MEQVGEVCWLGEFPMRKDWSPEGCGVLNKVYMGGGGGVHPEGGPTP